MSRWHKLSCDVPDVVVEEVTNTPRCQACDSTFDAPHLEQLISQPKTSTEKPWSPPPDIPPGEWDLWWPPSVRYTGGCQSQLERDAIHGPAFAQVDEIANQTIYERELESDEIRLIFVEPAVGDYLLHASLEIWKHEYCPEYETVSYTWGGEEDDSRRLFPIFIGPYWDVLLQTRNCLSMLLYARPKQGMRTLWVDAISINQDHVMERKAQISRMGEIYQRCLRVVVYLGDDVVREISPSSPRCRTRKPLPHQVLSPDLLQRRYFGRLWIIQELILAPALMIPIGEVDYLVQGLTSSRLSGGSWDWYNTATPWLGNMGQGAYFQKLGLIEALRQTWGSTATDRRDKIFGLLGLVDTGDSPHESLVPEYSISFLETFVGVCGYLLITLADPAILINCWKHGEGAAALRYPKLNESGGLSWVPRWRSSSIWNPEPSDLDSLWNLRPYTPPASLNSKVYIICWRIASKSPFGQKILPPIRRQIPTEVVWNQRISVDASTGALSIRMTHLMNLSKLLIVPLTDPSSNPSSSGITHFKIRSKTTSMIVCTAEIPLEQVINCQPDDIFLLETGPREDLLLFFTKKSESGNSYRIIASGRCYLLYLHAHSPLRGPTDYWKNYWDTKEHNLILEPQRVFSSLNPKLIGMYSLSQVKSFFFEELDREFFWPQSDLSSPWHEFTHLFPTPSVKMTYRKVLPFVRCVQREGTEKGGSNEEYHPGFDKDCLEFFQLHFRALRPKLKKGTLVLQYSYRQFRQQQKDWKRQYGQRIKSTWHDEGFRFQHPKDSSWLFPSILSQSKTVSAELEEYITPGSHNFTLTGIILMRASTKDIWACIKSPVLLKGLKCLRDFRDDVGEDELDIALGEMKPEYNNLYSMFWPEDAQRELNLDYFPQTITIV